MLRYIAFLCLLCSCVDLRASDLLDAPKSVPACKSFIIEAVDGKTTGPISCKLFATDTDVLVTYSVDRRAVMLRCPTARRLPVAVSLTANGKESMELVDIEVTGTMPHPTPKPDAKPDLSGFALQVYAEASKVKSPTRKETALRIASSLKAVRAKVVSGSIDTSEDENKTVPPKMVKEIKNQVGTLPAAWSDWTTWWNTAGRAYYEQSGKMSPGNWLDLLDATVAGLERVE